MKKTFLASILISSLALGFLLIIQFNTEKPIESSFPLDEVEARDELLKSFLNEQSYLQSRIVSLREQIEESQESTQLQSEKASIEALNDLKAKIGLTEKSGEGLEIIMDDSSLAYRGSNEVLDIYLVQASDIRDTINVLNAAHTEGISINNQRIIATSPITSVGTTILVNNSHIAPPFVINAIGDPEIILQRLRDESSMLTLYERFQQSELVFKIGIKETVTVPIYNGNLQNEYINLVEE